MSKLTLLLAFHNHQPDGNFDSVFEQGYAVCYDPLLSTLVEFPKIRCALHYTGPLLEWIEAHHPDHLARIRDLAARGQVEVLGGGFYEPMLATLPDRDALGQIAMMGDFCAHHFGARPKGMWLAERVWEPSLADLLSRAGIAYTLIDDTHFRYAGIDGELRGHYVTEKAGRAVAIFPIERRLRYAIPFREIDDALRTLRELRDGSGAAPPVVTYGDDGEKFGMWPGTKEWVWDKGWLRGFFGRLSEQQDRAEGDGGYVETSTFSDHLARHRAGGRVYLPTASYEEMGEWALPADAQARYLELRGELEARGELERARPFFRGGIWQGFLAKYPEANFMHKKMVQVSEKLARAEEANAGRTSVGAGPLEAARRELYRAQCNCAYWHGLFGGLYLNYLRHAVYRHLIGAELEADRALGRLERPSVEVRDLDADLDDEVALATPELEAYVKPAQGGGVFELDVRGKRFNLANVLGRRPEGYHARLRQAAEHGGHGGDAPRSIHDLAQVKEAGLEELLRSDRHARMLFVDQFLAPGAGTSELARTEDVDLGDFAGGAYEIVGTAAPGGPAGAESAAGSAVSVILRRRGSVRAEGGSRAVTVEKTFTLEGARLAARYRVSIEDGGPPLAVRFAPEVSITLLAGNDGGRRYRVPGRSEPLEGGDRMVSRGAIAAPALELVDDWSGMVVTLSATPGALWHRYPIETASQSEGGFERTYQGSAVVAEIGATLQPGAPFEAELALSVADVAAGA